MSGVAFNWLNNILVTIALASKWIRLRKVIISFKTLPSLLFLERMCVCVCQLASCFICIHCKRGHKFTFIDADLINKISRVIRYWQIFCSPWLVRAQDYWIKTKKNVSMQMNKALQTLISTSLFYLYMNDTVHTQFHLEFLITLWSFLMTSITARSISLCAVDPFMLCAWDFFPLGKFQSVLPRILRKICTKDSVVFVLLRRFG